MAKGSHSVASMSEICDYNGQPFANISDQKEFIRNHLLNLLKDLLMSQTPWKDASRNF
jgi:hypothetical protein